MEKLGAIGALAALAQDSRLDIFRLLVQVGVEGMPAGQIGERLGLPSATLSFHLSQLKQAKLVTSRRDGRSLIYAAGYAAMNDLLTYLTDNCCRNTPDTCADGRPCGPAAVSPENRQTGVCDEALARSRVR